MPLLVLERETDPRTVVQAIDGVQYDYYEWCANGRRLYCLDVAAGNWLNLA